MKKDFKETKEQELITSKRDFSMIVIKAFAGTGKTTTLKQFAKNNPNSKILYIAYNKEIAAQARKSFPSNVEARTAHSLAYSKFGKKLEKKLDRKNTLPFKPETIRRSFGFSKDQKSIKISKSLFKILENYCFSNYKNIKDAIPYNINLPIDRNELGFFAELLWEDMIDPENKFPTIPDVYLKQYVLSKPILNYDYILFDESQDANPLILELILNQKMNNVKLVFVGDEHQSIYQFRGAKNAFNNITPDEELYLTESFRFGENIANVANMVLKIFKKENKEIIGQKTINDNIGIVDKTKQFAVISRTNSSLLLNALTAYEQGKSVCFVGGFNSYNFKQILDLEHLYMNNFSKIKDNYIKTFDSYKDYESTANFSNDKEMIYNMRIVKKYAGSLNKTFNALKTQNKDLNNADIILSTVHKSKGLEFSQVILSNDFQSLLTKDNTLLNYNITEDEVNMIYVAITRAINVLQVNKNIESFMNFINENKQENCVFKEECDIKSNYINKISNFDNKNLNKF